MLVRHDQQLQHIGRTVAAAQQGVGSDTAKALLRHEPWVERQPGDGVSALRGVSLCREQRDIGGGDDDGRNRERAKALVRRVVVLGQRRRELDWHDDERIEGARPPAALALRRGRDIVHPLRLLLARALRLAGWAQFARRAKQDGLTGRGLQLEPLAHGALPLALSRKFEPLRQPPRRQRPRLGKHALRPVRAADEKGDAGDRLAARAAFPQAVRKKSRQRRRQVAAAMDGGLRLRTLALLGAAEIMQLGDLLHLLLGACPRLVERQRWRRRWQQRRRHRRRRRWRRRSCLLSRRVPPRRRGARALSLGLRRRRRLAVRYRAAALGLARHGTRHMLDYGVAPASPLLHRPNAIGVLDVQSPARCLVTDDLNLQPHNHPVGRRLVRVPLDPHLVALAQDHRPRLLRRSRVHILVAAALVGIRSRLIAAAAAIDRLRRIALHQLRMPLLEEREHVVVLSSFPILAHRRHSAECLLDKVLAQNVGQRPAEMEAVSYPVPSHPPPFPCLLLRIAAAPLPLSGHGYSAATLRGFERLHGAFLFSDPPPRELFFFVHHSKIPFRAGKSHVDPWKCDSPLHTTAIYLYGLSSVDEPSPHPQPLYRSRLAPPLRWLLIELGEAWRARCRCFDAAQCASW